MYELDGLCCLGIFCPCVVYGKTQYRLSQKAQKKEATDLLGYKAVNGSCGLLAVACGFQCEHSQWNIRLLANGSRALLVHPTYSDSEAVQNKRQL